MSLEKDIKLKDTAFTTASADIKALKDRAEKLKAELNSMYEDLTTALDTPAGKEIQITAKNVLIKPIDDLILVIKQMSETLEDIISSDYYKGVFDKYASLVQNL